MKAGDIIGKKYRLVRRLGAGAMGEVWAAINETLSSEVAIKLMVQQNNEELRQRLLREARACGSLKHRNIIRMIDVGATTDDEPFLVMEMLTGETLAELLARRRSLKPQEAASIGRDIALALEVAHKAGIIHRDLKPANVFLHNEAGSSGPVVKVLDFGVSKNLLIKDGLSTVTGGMVGSPAYMSPEQARARRDLDHRSDLWSFGVLLFEMLTGTRPFQGDANNIILNICLAEIPPLSRFLRNVPPALDAVVSRCLQRDVQARMGSAAELAALLEPIARGEGVAPARPPQPSTADIDLDDEDLAATLPLQQKMLGALRHKAQGAPPPASAAPYPMPARRGSVQEMVSPVATPRPPMGSTPHVPSSGPYGTAPMPVQRTRSASMQDVPVPVAPLANAPQRRPSFQDVPIPYVATPAPPMQPAAPQASDPITAPLPSNQVPQWQKMTAPLPPMQPGNVGLKRPPGLEGTIPLNPEHLRNPAPSFQANTSELNSTAAVVRNKNATEPSREELAPKAPAATPTKRRIAIAIASSLVLFAVLGIALYVGFSSHESESAQASEAARAEPSVASAAPSALPVASDEKPAPPEPEPPPVASATASATVDASPPPPVETAAPTVAPKPTSAKSAAPWKTPTKSTKKDTGGKMNPLPPWLTKP